MVKYTQSWMGRLNVINLANCSPNLTCKYNTILVKIPTGFFTELNNLMPKFMLENKGLEIPSFKKEDSS